MMPKRFPSSAPLNEPGAHHLPMFPASVYIKGPRGSFLVSGTCRSGDDLCSIYCGTLSLLCRTNDDPNERCVLQDTELFVESVVNRTVLTMSLPPELVIMVLHHLRDDKTALARCSLVCHAWVGHAYQHIFRVLTIHKPAAGLGKAVTNLLLYLRSAPHLGSYVHELTLAANELAPRSHRTLYVPDLFALLTYLNRLRVLEISHAHLDFPQPFPSGISSMTRRKLFKLILTSLTASAGSFALAQVVGHFADIEESYINDFSDYPLSLAFFGVGPPGQATSLPSCAPTRVRSFTVKHCGRLIGPASMLILPTALCLPALKTLSLQLHDLGSIAALNETVQATGLSLSHLDLNLLRLPLSYDPRRSYHP